MHARASGPDENEMRGNCTATAWRRERRCHAVESPLRDTLHSPPSTFPSRTARSRSSSPRRMRLPDSAFHPLPLCRDAHSKKTVGEEGAPIPEVGHPRFLWGSLESYDSTCPFTACSLVPPSIPQSPSIKSPGRDMAAIKISYMCLRQIGTARGRLVSRMD
jgi:hypothetical protein